MSAAVDHVHHRYGKPIRTDATDVAEEGQKARPGAACAGQRAGQDRVGPEIRLIFGAVGLDHRPIDGGLVGDVQIDQRFGKRFVDVLNRLADALSEIAVLRIGIAQLDCASCLPVLAPWARRPVPRSRLPARRRLRSSDSRGYPGFARAFTPAMDKVIRFTFSILDCVGSFAQKASPPNRSEFSLCAASLLDFRDLNPPPKAVGLPPREQGEAFSIEGSSRRGLLLKRRGRSRIVRRLLTARQAPSLEVVTGSAPKDRWPGVRRTASQVGVEIGQLGRIQIL